MIRIIRLLGAALGAFIGLGLATASGLFQETGSSYGLILAALDRRLADRGLRDPALPHDRARRPGSCAASRPSRRPSSSPRSCGLIIGLLMGLLLGAPLSNFPDPLGRWLPLATSIGFGLGMVGLTVAKRQDLIVAAEAIGVFRRPEAADAATARKGDPHIIVDTSAIIDGRIKEIVESGFIYGTLVDPALRPRGAPAHRRQLRHAPPQSWPAGPRDPGPDAEGFADAGRDRRGRGPRRDARSMPSWSPSPSATAGRS